MTGDSLLDIGGLNVSFHGETGTIRVLRDVSVSVAPDSVVGLVGESGSGKSTLALAIMGLLSGNAEMDATVFRFAGDDAPDLPFDQRRARGRTIAMVFQDPMSALNPLFSIGTIMAEAQRKRFPDQSTARLLERAVTMLARVGVPDASQRIHLYPHEFSGGMRQRVMIAMAFLVEPRLLIADEPTTALDATIEAQIMELLRDLRDQTKCSVLLVSHSLGLVSELCDEIVVMYAGTVVERGPAGLVLGSPLHPYTRALISCEIDPEAPVTEGEPLRTISGSVPDLSTPPTGCVFAARCSLRHDRCDAPPPVVLRPGDHSAACWLA